MHKRLNQRGFTLMELMVVIVIVAILAAVAVPLYINYVKDAQRTEAKGAIAAIITAEQVYLQKYGTYLNYADANFALAQSAALAPDKRLDVDLSEARAGGKWKFDVTAASATKFTVSAVNSGADLGVVYQHDRIAGSTALAPQWKEGNAAVAGGGTQ